MYELYFISLASEVKTELIKPWNVGKYNLLCDHKLGPKYEVLYETGIWILQLDSFMFIIFYI